MDLKTNYKLKGHSWSLKNSYQFPKIIETNFIVQEEICDIFVCENCGTIKLFYHLEDKEFPMDCLTIETCNEILIKSILE